MLASDLPRTDAAGVAVAVAVAVRGRCAIGEDREFSCLARLRDAERAEIACDYLASEDDLGRAAIGYFEGVGPLAGRVEALTAAGFVLAVGVTPERRARIDERLAWLRAHADGLPDRRAGGARIVPRRRDTPLRLPDGRERVAEIADLSRSGAALAAPERPAIGAVVTVGKRFATVVRHTEDGFAVMFRLPLSAETFNEHVVL